QAQVLIVARHSPIWHCRPIRGNSNGIAPRGSYICPNPEQKVTPRRYGNVRTQVARSERRSLLILWRKPLAESSQHRRVAARQRCLRTVINDYSISIRKRPVCYPTNKLIAREPLPKRNSFPHQAMRPGG